MVFFKYCSICEKRFKPTGKKQKLCENGRLIIKRNNLLKMFNSRGCKVYKNKLHNIVGRSKCVKN